MDATVKFETPSPSVTPAEVRTAPPSLPELKSKASLSRRRYVWILVGISAILVIAFPAWRMYFSPLTVSIAPVQSNVREQVFGLGQIGARVQSNLGFKVAGGAGVQPV